MATLYDKIWYSHTVHSPGPDRALLYIDLHLVHEVTSPQAFEGLRIAGRTLRRPDLTFGTVDHAIPTVDRDKPFRNKTAAVQVETLRSNAEHFGFRLYDLDRSEQGIVHVFGPEQGLVHPGMTIVCGDSHTSTHGAFGALAFGIGTSEVEHVLATQCLIQKKAGNLRISVDGSLGPGVTAKDLILGIINRIGTDGATGHVIEYSGGVFSDLSMEGRMTVCNMSIEAGARAGLIAPDEKTVEYVKGRTFAPKGEGWEAAVEKWDQLYSDPDAEFEREVRIDASELEPFITWGTSPGMSSGCSGAVPDPASASDPNQKFAYEKALLYMGLEPGQPLTSIAIDRVFIGSCTNGRIEDLREAAKVVKGKKVAPNVLALVVPGSMKVKKQAEEEGLAAIFEESGFEWRDAGCSMCIAMNDDMLSEGERCASTSNRNFEGRQGRGGRTHLVSPAMAAAAAVAGHFVDVRDWDFSAGFSSGATS